MRGCMPTKFTCPLLSVSPLRSDGPAIVTRTSGIGRPCVSVTVIAMPARDGGGGVTGRRTVGAAWGAGAVCAGASAALAVDITTVKLSSVLKRILRLCLYSLRTWALQ